MCFSNKCEGQKLSRNLIKDNKKFIKVALNPTDVTRADVFCSEGLLIACWLDCAEAMQEIPREL
jgi:hypothetical protein